MSRAVPVVPKEQGPAHSKCPGQDEGGMAWNIPQKPLPWLASSTTPPQHPSNVIRLLRHCLSAQWPSSPFDLVWTREFELWPFHDCLSQNESSSRPGTAISSVTRAGLSSGSCGTVSSSGTPPPHQWRLLLGPLALTSRLQGAPLRAGRMVPSSRVPLAVLQGRKVIRSNLHLLSV